MSKDHDGIDDPGTPESVDPAADAAPGADEQDLSEDSTLDTTDDTSAAHDEAAVADVSLSKTDSVSADADSEAAENTDDPDDEDADLAVPVGAGVAAGSARAAARRSAVHSGVTEKKGRPTAAREDSEERRPNPFARLARFLREVIGELRKVIWPTRNQMVTYTIVVLVFVVFMTALVFGLDWVFARGVLAVFG